LCVLGAIFCCSCVLRLRGFSRVFCYACNILAFGVVLCCFVCISVLMLIWYSSWFYSVAVYRCAIYLYPLDTREYRLRGCLYLITTSCGYCFYSVARVIMMLILGAVLVCILGVSA
jgi:uncharacterized phage infection (PIP) family protein YhgE